MWVGQLSGNVHLEVVMIANDTVSELKNCVAFMGICLRSIHTRKSVYTEGS